jgi:DNA-binding transcriptional regulator YiaG
LFSRMSSYSTSACNLMVPEFSASVENSTSNTIKWLQDHLNLSDEYIASLIKVRREILSEWKNGNSSLTSSQIRDLETFSSTLLRVLSFLNFRRDLMMKFLEFHGEHTQQRSGVLSPPWLGTSLKTYMMTHGVRGIKEVDSWVQAMRLADSF